MSIMKLPMFRFQIIYTAIIFAVFSLLKPNSITIWDGLKGAFCVLGVTVYFILIFKFMSSSNKYICHTSLSRSIKFVRAVFNVINYIMFGLFIISSCLAIISFIEVLISNVPAITSYILLLVVPMWLSVRESISIFLKLNDK